MATLPPAVLLGGESIAVSAARGLAATGVEVHALGHATDPIRASRACRRFVDAGGKEGRVERYLAWLDEHRLGAAILPCDDDGLEMVARHRATLAEWGHLPVEADDDVLLAMLDKERTYELSRAAGVPTPRTATVRSHADAEAAAADFPFPCALKPLHSHVFAQHFSARDKVLVVESADDLHRQFERMLAHGVQMLVTEIVPGDDRQFCSYYTYVSSDGEPLFHFTKRKLRQFPIGFGLTCYQETNWEPVVAAHGERFCRETGLRGVANIEFKHDARDGEWKIIECNHRFSAANELVRAAGIDIPVLAYNRLVGRPDPPVSSYRLGLRMWHPLEDLRALRDYRRTGEWTTSRWALSLLHRQHFPMLDARDPGPTLASLATKLGRRRPRLRAPAAPAPEAAA